MRPHAVHAVIAVKSLDQAKSRLADRLRPEHRARLVLAMLADTVTAAATVEEIASVTVVTPDPAVAELARTLGAAVHPEPRPLGPDSLNAALADAAAALRHRHGAVDLLAVQADLPALRPEELADMLATAPRGVRSIVVDHAGTGTAALLVRDPVAPLDPRFGPGSADKHVAAGAVDLPGDWPGLRLDVDTADDLDLAIELGAGGSTRAVLHDIGWQGRVHQPVRRVC
ncbi:2-phospho-L-lactate guanylyltransferase [Nocardia brasiliensis]|uniref:2-phospho-L-lactate guanylyltransferase n=1 Tax=Nocardia brasiliensis TaxID=37326 RepID=UPI0018944204|nr:2-phospho-L-lactate guanylyltransferase [Nocardia brasiliensis]MBF6128323.1 2-phospho-L-lactate guanylyltransferase [Nocardia brasiliensis]MBF6544685.1 2-phospho-L-lactate guanylyltransferase [Nocardia brasiliensis]